MTVFASAGQATTMDYKANDAGYVPGIAGHYIQNAGNDDLVMLKIFKSDVYQKVTTSKPGNWPFSGRKMRSLQEDPRD